MDEPTLFPLPPTAAESGPSGATAPPRVQRPNRLQVEWQPYALDQLLPPRHRVRLVWHFVEQLDLSALYARIAAVEGEPGRPAIDPQILLALWLYATLKGVGSARELDRLCTEHRAYQWLCGGVSVNYHTLADFRVQHEAILDDLLTQGVAALVRAGVVDPRTLAQDGLKVRASAGAGSFRRKATLQECLQAAQQRVQRLRHEVATDPGAASRRQQAAQRRAAREREQRVNAALAEVHEIEQARVRQRNPKGDEDVRASTTDPEARVMKLSDGGYRPAYNLQLTTAMQGRIVVGVDATNAGSDMGQLEPMLQRLHRSSLPPPQTVVADGGYGKKQDIETVSGPPYECLVIIPVQEPKKEGQDPFAPRPRDPPAVAAWRQRMGTPEAQGLAKQRGSVAEWVHAQARNRGLTQVRVRGRLKVRAIALWHALANNLVQGHRLLPAATPAPT